LPLYHRHVVRRRDAYGVRPGGADRGATVASGRTRARCRSGAAVVGTHEGKGRLMWRVTVNDRCVGSGSCIGIARRHFRLDRDDRSPPVDVEVAPSEAVLDAAASCPMEAILVVDLETDEVLEPWH